MTEAKKHHYVPRSVLKNFSIDRLGKQIHVFDKSTEKAWKSSLMDAGSENHFNSLEIDGRRFSFEPLFEYIDRRLAELTNILLNERSLKSLNSEEIIELSEIVAVQLSRTKLVRTTQQEMNKDILEWMRKIDLYSADVSPMTNQEARKSALSFLGKSGELGKEIANKIPILLESTGNERFWISDNPVVMFNSYPYGEQGINSPGIEIYFPIANDLTLAYFCPSIIRKARDISNIPVGKLEPELRTKSVRLNYAASSGNPMPFADDGVKFINELQVRRSSRFLYASDSDFSLACNVLENAPDAKNVRSLFTLGMQTNPNMPAGLWLVVYGHLNHYMLPIVVWDEKSKFIDICTDDKTTLDTILSDTPLVQATLYEDGSQRCSMREIKIELIGQSVPQKLRVIHNDDSLNEIVEHRR